MPSPLSGATGTATIESLVIITWRDLKHNVQEISPQELGQLEQRGMTPHMNRCPCLYRAGSATQERWPLGKQESDVEVIL